MEVIQTFPNGSTIEFGQDSNGHCVHRVCNYSSSICKYTEPFHCALTYALQFEEYFNFKDKKIKKFLFLSICNYSMVHLNPVDRLLHAAVTSDEAFIASLNDILKHDLRISVKDLGERSGIAQSSLYKILHGKRSPNLTTVRAICRAIQTFNPSEEGGI
jgi:DNA-binding phage protein